MGMENKGPAHSQDAAEKTGFEHDIIPRRCLALLRLSRSRRAARPVVLCKDKGREIDFPGELEEAFQRRCPWVEGRGPGLDMREVFEAAS